MKCPNCGWDAMSHSWSNAKISVDHCQECGALRDGRWFIPRRSVPAVPVELPDAEGWWWVEKPTGWYCHKYERSAEGKLRCLVGGFVLLPVVGRYVKATPPIVAKPPEPTAAEDAWHLRHIAANVHMSNVQKSQLERIAVRIEASGKEVK